MHAEQREMATALVRTHLPPLLPELLTSLKDQGYIDEASAGRDHNVYEGLLLLMRITGVLESSFYACFLWSGGGPSWMERAPVFICALRTEVFIGF